MNSLGTAILVFANSAKQDLANKHIPKGEHLFDVLTQTTLKKAKKTGLPVFHFSDEDQVGVSFGERFTNAIASVFDRGFSNIITIGNDTPHLKTQHLKHTAQQLAMGNTVIGPSIDGGFYLLGLQKSNFEVAEFQNFPWQRFSLYHQISLWLQKESSELIKLPVLQDLDNEGDLQSLLSFSTGLSISLLLLIIGLLKINRSLYNVKQNFSSLFPNSFLYNKGSPTVSFI
ncbi:TIGR04282 family arsenosugar biosynthesis glycosyltransferase [Maribacter hydrothermalis]|uniref:DUF2064 domain-containing protein n=1 Tax=Maribacter hydrothermalis TaxID=1836467 RepID=A0A1B7ZE76_9FLAO|nr:DUF2064 domain-containing protein [Maribacter hydrothermalis]APQ17378.1 hypothetical protein BTR34_08605 [Maribacter hydrothermalis]OBR41856.1 hypothetical protein A9200_00255 [Maribacter hydrothermalis]